MYGFDQDKLNCVETVKMVYTIGIIVGEGEENEFQLRR